MVKKSMPMDAMSRVERRSECLKSSFLEVAGVEAYWRRRRGGGGLKGFVFEKNK